MKEASNPGFTERYLEHPEDVLAKWIEWHATSPVALVVVTATIGGAVRRPGALMAVTADGRAAGYISGGCIDADVILQAQRSLAEGKPLKLRYGAGSPFLDLPLPCGGAIEISILPQTNENVIRSCHTRLAARSSAEFTLTENLQTFFYAPKLRLRIAGRGADPLALARLARASGIETILYLPDGPDMRLAEEEGHANLVALGSASELPAVRDDPWSAFVMMFHDAEREDALLADALAGDAFFVGAVGSARTHALRCERLRRRGVPEADIQRIHGPVGLVPSMRDASMLAVSVLSQVVAEYHKRHASPFARTALVLLAAGRSTRFARGDKLLMPFQGRKLLDHAAACLPGEPVAARLAVVPAVPDERSDLLQAAGWSTIPNPHTRTGLSSSLKCGVQAASENAYVDHVMIILADMPAIPAQHLHRLQQAVHAGHPAAMSLSGGRLSPPAIFSRSVFERLLSAQGDTGARDIFQSLEGGVTVPLHASYAFDIDTEEDLNLAEETANG